MKNYIAIDIGTTNCKAIRIDEEGKLLANHQLPVVSITDDNGCFEQNPELIFLSIMVLLEKAIGSDGDNIACISFSAAMHSIMAINVNGKLLSNAMIWADTRSKRYAQGLKDQKVAAKIHDQTGTPIHAMSPLSKIIWFRYEQKEVFKNTFKFISIKEYIFYRLTGKYIVDEGIASCTGLYDIYNHCWFDEAMEIAGINKLKLSDVVPVTHIEKDLLPEIIKQYPFLKGLILVCGGNDGCLANLGCGALYDRQSALSIGTSGAIRLAERNPEKVKLYPLFRYLLSRDVYVTGGPTNNGGIVIDWFAKNFLGIPIDSDENFQRVMEKAAEAEAGSEGVYFLPYLLGERAPIWDADASGLFYGLKIKHQQSHLTRAVIEGISFNLMQILEAIENTGKQVDEVIVTGVITKSSWWMQLLADVFGKKIILNEPVDASAMGAAMIGMLATGKIKSFEEVKGFSVITQTFYSDEKAHERYKLYYEEYKRLYSRKTIPE
ncbi:MAG: gluconokinase [Ginsengibacter sp.]